MRQTSGESPTRVLVVDSHDIFRTGVAAVLDAHDEFDVIGTAPSLAGAAAVIGPQPVPAQSPGHRSTRPHVVVVGIRGREHEGLADEVAATLPPDVRLVVLSRVDDSAALTAAMGAGAGALLTKDVSTPRLVSTVSAVARGENVLDHTRALAVVRQRNAHSEQAEVLGRLTPQERRILTLIADGMSNRQIAEELFLVEKTVRNHVTRVLAKLGVQRRTQAALIAARLGLVQQGAERRVDH